MNEARVGGRFGSGRNCATPALTESGWGLQFGLLARGHSTREIAQALVVTPKTAANHIEHIYTKLGISSRAAATLYATRHGLMGAFEPAS